jgi:hypothetical protein
MKISQKQIVHEGFFHAAIAYYLGGDWRRILLEAKNRLIGSHRRLFEDLSSCGEDKFHTVVCRYLDGFVEEQMRQG